MRDSGVKNLIKKFFAFLEPEGGDENETVSRLRMVIIILAGAAALFLILAIVQGLTESVLQRQLDAMESYSSGSDSASDAPESVANLREYANGLKQALDDEKKKSSNLDRQVKELTKQVEDLRSESASRETLQEGAAGAAGEEPEEEPLSEEAGTAGTAPVDQAAAERAKDMADKNVEAQLEAESLMAKAEGIRRYGDAGVALKPTGEILPGNGASGEALSPGEDDGETRVGTAVSPTGVYRFTDKNGDTSTFTSDEWEYLLSIWEYTGKAQEMLEEHTVSELRSALAAR
jgi:hypothetical protein